MTKVFEVVTFSPSPPSALGTKTPTLKGEEVVSAKSWCKLLLFSGPKSEVVVIGYLME